MSGATSSLMMQDAPGPGMLAPSGASEAMGFAPNSSGMILQPVFIPRPPAVSAPASHMPNSPLGSLAASASADWAFLLRSAAAMTGSNSQAGLAGMLESMGHGSSPNNVQDMVPNSGMRVSPQFNSSPSLLYSPASSAAPNNSGYYAIAELAPEGLTAPGADPNGMVMQHLSGSNNLTSSMSAAAAAAAAANMYGGNDNGVQTLYPSSSNNNLAMAAAGAAQRAVQTQALLQQQAAAVNSLSNNLSSMGLGGAGNGMSGGLEESLSGSLFAAAAAAAANSAKPVSSSLYIKNLPPDADKLFLYEKFSPFGAILSVKVLTDPQSGQCRGVGFVNFAEHASAVRSIQALHGTKVGDKSMHVSLQTPRIRASALHTAPIGPSNAGQALAWCGVASAPSLSGSKCATKSGAATAHLGRGSVDVVGSVSATAAASAQVLCASAIIICLPVAASTARSLVCLRKSPALFVQCEVSFKQNSSCCLVAMAVGVGVDSMSRQLLVMVQLGDVECAQLYCVGP
ncbi:hypothetical protein COO60DRAFT_1632412 [Scenedesmus sp. NREL 46B-D3]|nr:hypothetical protein COO60DRAFT_1632412 [Scenedesmus sp. NREL 46B-D3]